MKKLKTIFSLMLVAVIVLSSTRVSAETLNLKDDDTLTVNNTYSGFKLMSENKLEEIQSTAYEFVHEKTGAKLIFLKNSDENKVFSITFRTPPKDNTGVNHIIEHTVLSGSKKYPVKDPFSEMSKQSLNTYLNAATYPDYTTFPVASKNEKDFENLMDVYLDAVFNPNIYKNQNTFRQEGIRYEMTSPKDTLRVNGIVYNEMKGNYSSPGTILNFAINKSLFPNSIYKYEAGGYPNDILKLTYKQFLETHKKNYTPANSYIYLYGNLDIKKALSHISEGYLNSFNKTSVDTKIALQPGFAKMANSVAYYSIPAKASIKDKTYLSLNYVIGKTTDKETSVAMEILDTLLMGKSSSPLRMALEDSGIAYNIESSYNNYALQPVYSLILENSNETERDKFQAIVKKSLNDVIKNGFDKKLVESVFNSFEIGMRKGQTAADRGNGYSDAIMKGWIYDNGPLTYLQMNDTINKIKEGIPKGYFNELIKTYMLDNKHASFVTLKPVQGLDTKAAAELKANLKKMQSKFSKKQIDEIVKETNAFKKWQATKDSKEAVETMPILSLSDISKESEKIKTSIEDYKGMKLLKHPYFTNGVGYVNMYFDSTNVPQDKLMYMILLGDLLGDVDTQKYKYTQLSDEIDTLTGGLGFSTDYFVDKVNTDKYMPKFVVSMAALDKNMKPALELAGEIMNNSKFTDKAHLKDSIKEIKSGIEGEIQENAHKYALRELQSYTSDAGKYNNLKYIPFYNFICELEKNFDKNSADIMEKLEATRELIFTDKNLVVSFTGDEKQYDIFKESFAGFSAFIKPNTCETQNYKFDYSVKNEGFMMSSDVQFVTKGANYRKLGFNNSGKLEVLANILNNDYIYQQVRVKNGAYGGYIGISSTNVSLYSYRDPNLKETIQIFNELPKYLRSFKADSREMTNFIIGAIGSYDGLSGVLEKADLGDNMYFSGTTNEDLQKYREEILSTTDADIRGYADMMEKVIKENNLCVIGGESKVKGDKGEFSVIKDIFEK